LEQTLQTPIASNPRGEERYSVGLIAGLTTSAFIVGMLLSFVICYIRDSRRAIKTDIPRSKPQNPSTAISPYVTPTHTGNNSRTASPQPAIPWDADSHAEGRDRVLDLESASAARPRWRQRFSRAMLPGLRPRASNRLSISSSTALTDSHGDTGSGLSPSGMTLSSYFYAPSTMPSVGGSRTRDRQSMLTN
jgi:hypothetical protein